MGQASLCVCLRPLHTILRCDAFLSQRVTASRGVPGGHPPSPPWALVEALLASLRAIARSSHGRAIVARALSQIPPSGRTGEAAPADHYSPAEATEPSAGPLGRLCLWLQRDLDRFKGRLPPGTQWREGGERESVADEEEAEGPTEEGVDEGTSTGSGDGIGAPGAAAKVQSMRTSVECTLQAMIRLCLTAFEIADGGSR